MSIRGISSSIDIAVSGLRAQAMRMQTASANIANVYTTKSETGGPYRRRQVLLETDPDMLGGVRVRSVESDMTTQFKVIHDPGHRDADAQGNVLMPNVDLPVEMMRMMTASRAYQANAAVLKRFQDSVDVTLELLR